MLQNTQSRWRSVCSELSSLKNHNMLPTQDTETGCNQSHENIAQLQASVLSSSEHSCGEKQRENHKRARSAVKLFLSINFTPPGLDYCECLLDTSHKISPEQRNMTVLQQRMSFELYRDSSCDYPSVAPFIRLLQHPEMFTDAVLWTKPFPLLTKN